MSKRKTDVQDTTGETPGFEKALSRLEAIVQEMESGRLSLEEMLTRFEEGQTLVKVCSEKLDQVERRIETLVKVGGTLTAKPFDEVTEDTDDEDAPSADEKDGGLPF